MARLQEITATKHSTAEKTAMKIVDDGRNIFDVYINAYVDKYAFIRELVANAFDATIEVWENGDKKLTKTEFLINNPIILSVNEDDAGQYIQIEETKGVGISPERMETYTLIGYSTKRNSDHQIGAKGVGRLSALAYDRREYYLTTVYDNMMYEYKVFYDGSNVQVSKQFEIPSKGSNRTVIRVYLTDFKREKSLIETYINKHLCFIENLVTKNLGYENKIASYKSFDNLYADVSGKRPWYGNRQIQVLLGNILYTLTGDLLRQVNEGVVEKLEDYNAILKLEVSDLPLTLNRDSIQVTDRATALIAEKSKLAYRELVKIEKETVEKQVYKVDAQTVKEYLNKINDINRETTIKNEANECYFASNKMIAEEIESRVPNIELLKKAELYYRRTARKIYKNYKHASSSYINVTTHYLINPGDKFLYPNKEIVYMLFKGLKQDEIDKLEVLLSDFTPLKTIDKKTAKEEYNRVFGTWIGNKEIINDINVKDSFEEKVKESNYYYVYNVNNKHSAVTFISDISKINGISVILIKQGDEKLVKKINDEIQPLTVDAIVDLKNEKEVIVKNNLAHFFGNNLYNSIANERCMYRIEVSPLLFSVIDPSRTTLREQLGFSFIAELKMQPDEFVEIVNNLPQFVSTQTNYEYLNDLYNKCATLGTLPKALRKLLERSYYSEYREINEGVQFLYTKADTVITDLDLATEFCKHKSLTDNYILNNIFTSKL